MRNLKKFWRSLGPGIIVGAADDDPAGIAIYALAGAKFGLTVLWTVLGTLPFMIIIQRMCGRIGLVSVLISVSSIVNIGAALSAMAAATQLLVPLPAMLISVFLVAIVTLLVIVLPYKHIARYLKWIALVMLSYVVAAFLVSPHWREVITNLFTPHFSLDKEYVAMIVAIYGTTISPYLFFWQASGAVEEERLHRQEGVHGLIPAVEPKGKPHTSVRIKNEIGTMYTDIKTGMIFSNMLTFFIMVLAASTLFKHGFSEVSTLQEMATILQPLAGNYANLLFLIGIIASGILAIPILAGSAAYAIAETAGWKVGLDYKFHRARHFYVVMALASLLGIAIPALGLQPVNILYYTGIIFGFVSPLIILMVIHMANNPKIMGQYPSRTWSNVIAYTLFLIMSASVIVMLLR